MKMADELIGSGDFADHQVHQVLDMATNQGHCTIQSVQMALGLSEELVQELLKRLEGSGLLVNQDDRWVLPKPAGVDPILVHQHAPSDQPAVASDSYLRLAPDTGPPAPVIRLDDPDQTVEVHDLLIEQIQINSLIQYRQALSEKAVLDYQQRLQAGSKPPPLIVFYDLSYYYLVDGFHRLKAAQNVGLAKLPCRIYPGTKEQARISALNANRRDTVPLSKAEKREKALRMLQAYGQWSNRQIAQWCGVSEGLIRAVREGSPHALNAKNRHFQNKHGTTSTMDTSSIGKNPPSKDKAAQVRSNNWERVLTNLRWFLDDTASPEFLPAATPQQLGQFHSLLLGAAEKVQAYLRPSQANASAG